MIEEYLRKWVAAGLVTVEMLDALTQTDVDQLGSMLAAGDEPSAISLVQGGGSIGPAGTTGAPGDGNTDADGNQLPYEVGKLYTFTDPETGSRYQQTYKGTTTRKLTGQLDAEGYQAYEDVPSWANFRWAEKDATPITRWYQADGTISNVQTASTVGYYTPDGEPRNLPSAMMPEDTAAVERQKDADALAREKFEYGKEQDVLDAQLAQQQLAQGYALDNAAIAKSYRTDLGDVRVGLLGAQSQAGVDFAKEGAAAPIEGPSGPGDWIKYWQRSQAAVDPNTGMRPPSSAAIANNIQGWLPPEQLARLQAATNVDPMGTNPLDVNPPAGTGYRVWDENNLAWRAETPKEFEYRTVVNPIRDLVRGDVQGWRYGVGEGGQPLQTQGTDAQGNPIFLGQQQAIEQRLAQETLGTQQGALANRQQFWNQSLNPMQQTAINQQASDEMMRQTAEWQRTNPQYVGPQVPTWATGVLQQTPGGRVNVGTLGQPGNVVRPASATQWANWSPSEQAGYTGLVGAQKGKYVPDELARMQQMWGGSAPGQQARRLVRSF